MESSPSSQPEVPAATPPARPLHPASLFQRREHAWRHLGYLYETGKLLEDVRTLEAALPELMALITQVLPVRTALVLEGVDASGEPLPEPPRLYTWRTPEVTDPEFTRALAQAASRHAFLLGQPRAPAPGGAEEDPVLVTLPLVARGRVSGTLQMQAAGTLSEEGLAFIDAVVHQLARAWERAHTLRREVLRRERAEAGEQRARQDQALVAHAGALLSRTPDPRASLPELARLLVPAWADGCVIDLFPDEADGPDSPERVVRQFVEPAGAPLAGAPASASFATRVLTAHPWVASPRAPVEPPSGRDLEHASWPGFPANLRLRLRMHGRVLGVLVLVSARPGHHDVLEPALLEALALRIAEAVDGARLTARARQALRWQEDLFSFVSHQLQAPLHKMTLTSEQLVRFSRDGAPHPRQQQLLESLLYSAGNLCELLAGLMERSAARGQGAPTQLRSFRVDELVNKALQLSRPLALGKRQQLVVGLSAALPRVRGDFELVFQVLHQLLGNAIAVTPPGGRVSLGARAHGAGVCLWVRDTGPGIAAADLPHLFAPPSSAAPASEGGHGIGLHRAHALVEAHGGALWVESPAGGGSTFLFTLPASPGEHPGECPGEPRR